jgi:hypothetical protein
VRALDRAVTLLVGALLVGCSLYLGIGAARDAVAPGEWRCDEALRRGVQTLVPARSREGALIVARFEDLLRRRVPNLRVLVATKMTEAAYASDAASANGTVQVYGFAIALAGFWCFWFGDGWAVFAVIPSTWFGVFGGALGAFMMTFPDRHRALIRRARRR